MQALTLKEDSMNKTNTPLLPVLRFSGFTSTWENQKVKELFIKLQTTSNISTNDLNNISGPAQNVGVSDIAERCNGYYNISKQKLPFLNTDAPFNIEKYKKAALQDKDIVSLDTYFASSKGKSVEIIGASDAKLVFAGSGTRALRLKKTSLFSPGYLGIYFNSPAYRNQIYPLFQGLVFKRISEDAWKRIIIVYPPSFEEQPKIAVFYRKLDDLINLYSLRYQKLEQLKNQLLQAMFSRI